jgi:hypothetical protein
MKCDYVLRIFEFGILFISLDLRFRFYISDYGMRFRFDVVCNLFILVIVVVYAFI